MSTLAIDLFCGLGGWSEGLLAEGFDVIGFDIERHRYPKVVIKDGDAAEKQGGSTLKLGVGRLPGTGFNVANEKAYSDALKRGFTEWSEYPAQLVLQDVLTLHGRQFKDAALIVASPPCQEYSYMAMPWSRAKTIAAEYRSGVRDVKKLTALFDACFRIQREACEAAGRHIPLIVENVRGAIPWVGRSRWNFGSFHLWGDVPALMPMTKGRVNFRDLGQKTPDGNCSQVMWKDREIGRYAHATPEEMEAHGFGHIGRNPVHELAGVKNARNWWSDGAGNLSATTGSKSPARKAASAAIAKIPLPLAQHIARTFKP
jgi:hypothetical protein